ncbi:hypothetical protein [Novosphingobium sp. JCM 18896]|uniref:hypothetical protein n=1 Tax=Novosphingobium sp. JCM 18896 TaxID=2989731 RepID=UPI002223AF9A|nr:hypothetical protein [Novosphingobium sp. JCM 18896]MCW1428047.1 hypothetical protein [Novosphingobium sp. JCM 18896]
MSRPAGNSWRFRSAAIVMLLPMLALAACGQSNDEAMAEKLAAAEAAAAKAVAAQQAAEKAAMIAASSRPAPPVDSSPSFDGNSTDLPEAINEPDVASVEPAGEFSGTDVSGSSPS